MISGPVTRARVGDLLDMTSRILSRETRAAADENGLLSKAEQAAAPSHVQEAAVVVRGAGGSGARVTVAALDAHLAGQVKTLLGGVNQSAGVGRSYASKAEVKAAHAENPELGARVMKAYEIVTGKRVDADGLAEEHVRAMARDSETTFRLFPTLEAAENYRDPRGRQLTWLVKTGENADRSSYIWGRNDLWAQKFDIDHNSGDRTVTGEH